MNACNLVRSLLLVCGLTVVLLPFPAIAQHDHSAKTAPQQTPAAVDGRHDFDFEIGTWKTHVSRLDHPLTGSTTWLELDGTSIVHKFLDGRANLVELDISGHSGRIEGVSLRLYNPDARQWSLNYSNINAGMLTAPVIGEFRNGRGEFFGQDTLGGRAILVRFVISCATADSCRFEQAFTNDGGKNWELNWIATDTRIRERADKS